MDLCFSVSIEFHRTWGAAGVVLGKRTMNVEKLLDQRENTLLSLRI